MKHEELPNYWKEKIKNVFKKEKVSALDFKYGPIEVYFEDESFIKFHYYLDIVDEERDEILILTEHCGYHLIPLGRGYNKIKRIE